MKAIIHISDHPFYAGAIREDFKTLPLSLPFKMGIHPEYSIPRLILNDEIKIALEKLYEIGSFVSTPLGESDLSTLRMNQFSDKLISVMGGDVSGKKLLEIGCGNGTLLNELKKKEAIVKGIEIGPQANVAIEKYGLEIHKEILSKEIISEKFDCIFSYGCLEHIDDLGSFFEQSRACLKNNGLFFHLVPNSELSFLEFNLDHLIHQHINYFTPRNGVKLFHSQGFINSSISLTKNKNELMIWGFLDEKTTYKWPLEIQKEELNNLKKYGNGLNIKQNNIKMKLDEMINKGESIGFYAGGEEYGYNYKNFKNIRYFDGDEYKVGMKWLSGLPRIEPPKNLVKNKVDKLIICRPHYFEDIYNNLVKMGVNPETIINIEELNCL